MTSDVPSNRVRRALLVRVVFLINRVKFFMIEFTRKHRKHSGFSADAEFWLKLSRVAVIIMIKSILGVYHCIINKII